MSRSLYHAGRCIYCNLAAELDEMLNKRVKQGDEFYTLRGIVEVENDDIFYVLEASDGKIWHNSAVLGIERAGYYAMEIEKATGESAEDLRKKCFCKSHVSELVRKLF